MRVPLVVSLGLAVSVLSTVAVPTSLDGETVNQYQKLASAEQLQSTPDEAAFASWNSFTPEHLSQIAFNTDAEDEDDADVLDDEDDAEVERHGKRKGWIYLIRHGEKVKNSDKTGLSERGIQRAKCLTNVFGSRNSDATYPIDYILAQDFKPTGQRRRPYETVKPLAKKHHLPLDHSCDRDDTECPVIRIKKETRKGNNVLVVWEHARLSEIARELGIKGLVYPSDRYDIVFKIRGKKVHTIFSEECDGLDMEWIDWRPTRQGRHGKSPHGGRLIDDESWADD